MLPSQPDPKEALKNFRAKLRGNPLVASVVSTSLGKNPNGGDSPEGIVVLHATAAPATVVEELRAIAREAAPGVPVYTFPSDPPIPL